MGDSPLVPFAAMPPAGVEGICGRLETAGMGMFQVMTVRAFFTAARSAMEISSAASVAAASVTPQRALTAPVVATGPIGRTV